MFSFFITHVEIALNSHILYSEREMHSSWALDGCYWPETLNAAEVSHSWIFLPKKKNPRNYYRRKMLNIHSQRTWERPAGSHLELGKVAKSPHCRFLGNAILQINFLKVWSVGFQIEGVSPDCAWTILKGGREMFIFKSNCGICSTDQPNDPASSVYWFL